MSQKWDGRFKAQKIEEFLRNLCITILRVLEDKTKS